MKTFLSIDLDFWFYDGYEDHQIDDMRLQCFNFFINLSKLNQSYSVDLIVNHENILPILKKSTYNRLVNIDYHDDICGKDFPELNCGTWVKFVDGRNDKLYQWSFPQASCKQYRSNGRCDWTNDLWKYPEKFTDWKEIKARKNLPSLKNIEVAGVCIVLSPPWIDQKTNIYKIGNMLKKMLQ